MKAYQHIDFVEHGSVLEVVLNRKGNERADHLNAVDGTVHAELASLFSELKEQTDFRSVLLSARGDAFSSGGDFGWFPELSDRAALERVRVDGKNLIYDLLDVAVPVVCCVEGPAIGLGASIALLCDIVFMSDTASIADPHVLVGIAAGDGGTLAWPLAVGPTRAKQYLLTGDAVSAVEAERIGLVNFVRSPDSVRSEALAFAQRLAAAAPLAVQYTKSAINAGIKAVAATIFDQAAAFEIATFQTADHAEALQALQAKRLPEFEGR